jgi:hypothetical protein
MVFSLLPKDDLPPPPRSHSAVIVQWYIFPILLRFRDICFGLGAGFVAWWHNFPIWCFAVSWVTCTTG